MISRYGVGATLNHAASVAANRLTPTAWWKALVLKPDHVDRGVLAHPKRSEGQMLDAAAMRPYARDPQNLLTEEFMAQREARGDLCHALFEGETLTSYGWYATQPVPLTEIDSRRVLHFDPAYAYMFNTFTLPIYRGQRLHAIGAGRALQFFAARGLKGLVCYVDSSNFTSLRACLSAGFVTFGHVIVVKAGNRSVYRSTPGCKLYDFRVEPAATGSR